MYITNWVRTITGRVKAKKCRLSVMTADKKEVYVLLHGNALDFKCSQLWLTHEEIKALHDASIKALVE